MQIARGFEWQKDSIFNCEDSDEALRGNGSNQQSLRAGHHFIFIEGNCHTSGAALDEESLKISGKIKQIIPLKVSSQFAKQPGNMPLQRYSETQNRSRDDQKDGMASRVRKRSDLFDMGKICRGKCGQEWPLRVL